MKNKIFFGVLFTTLTLGGSLIASAQERPLKSKIEEAQKQREERREEIKTERTEKRIEMQQSVAKRKAENTERVILALVERLENIADRLASRLAKAKEDGADTTAAESHLASARADLASTKAKAETLSTIDLSADKAQDNFKRVREVAAEIKALLRSAHTHLMEAAKAHGRKSE